MKYSKGICWIGDCRIPFVDEGDIPNDMDKTHLDGRNFYTQVYNGFMYNQNTQGRFTPNLLVCDDMLNDGSVSKTNTSIIKPSNNSNSNILGGGKGIPPTKERIQNGDSGSSSRYYDLDKWFDKIIDSL
jgi:hypothetical protein